MRAKNNTCIVRFYTSSLLKSGSRAQNMLKTLQKIAITVHIEGAVFVSGFLLIK